MNDCSHACMQAGWVPYASPQNNSFTKPFLDFFYYSSNGRCVPYYWRESVYAICDNLYNPDIDYVYIPKRRLHGSQYLLRQFTEEAVPILAPVPERCRDIVIRVMCTHYYLPCGSNGTLHVPLPICSDVCMYVSETKCSDVWKIIVNYLDNTASTEFRNDEGIKLPSCNDTDYIIDYLNLTRDCCTNGGIILPITSTTGKLIMLICF